MKRALTYDDAQAIRGIGVVIAPIKHPSRSAWRAQRTRYGKQSHLRTVSTKRSVTSSKPSTVETPPKPRQHKEVAVVTHDDGTTTRYVMRHYRDTATLATCLIMDNVPMELARTITEEHRYYLDSVGTPATLVDVQLGAGRGW